MQDFRVPFNRGKQYFVVYLEDVTPTTFHRRGGGRWGFWQASDERNDRLGLFGEMHLVAERVRNDVVAHELFHVVADWLSGKAIVPQNEERLARLMDELTRNFWREYGKAVH